MAPIQMDFDPDGYRSSRLTTPATQSPVSVALCNGALAVGSALAKSFSMAAQLSQDMTATPKWPVKVKRFFAECEPRSRALNEFFYGETKTICLAGRIMLST
jgi:hypothetical protein